MLEPVLKIDPPSWMKDRRVKTLLSLLESDSNIPGALFVGGCVRNVLLGLDVSDIDIATIYEPDEVIGRLESSDIRVVPTGIDHGTVTAVIDGHSFEVTTLRQDISTDGRRAVVSYTKDWKLDAQRRDFTMNTLLADARGQIYDPLGQGASDLDKHFVRFVGDPELRIQEDYLRILRYFRFHGWYGHGTPDWEALKACENAAYHIKELSRERITNEFLKILEAPEPDKILSLMFHHKVLVQLPGALFDPAHVGALVHLQRFHDRVDIEARLLLVLLGNEGLDKNFENFLALPKKSIRKIETLSEIAGTSLNAVNVDYLKYKFGADIAWQAVLLIHALSGNKTIDKDMLAGLEDKNIPQFEITGDDLKALGVRQGADFGKILNCAEQWWVKQDMKPGRKECLAYLKTLCDEK
jgi:poly(A) polymerase